MPLSRLRPRLLTAALLLCLPAFIAHAAAAGAKTVSVSWLESMDEHAAPVRKGFMRALALRRATDGATVRFSAHFPRRAAHDAAF